MTPTFDFPASRERLRAELASRPPFLLKMFEKFGVRLELKPLVFVELHGGQGLSRSDRRRLEPRLPERRKAMIAVAGVLLTDMDLPSMCAAKLRTDGGFSGLGHDRIAERSGLNVGRVGRVIGDLVDAGYLIAHQPIEPYLKADGSVGYCAHNTIYRFTELFFRRCDYDKRLERERKKAAERRAGRVRIYSASLLRARRAWRKLRTFGALTFMERTSGPPRPRPRVPDRS